MKDYSLNKQEREIFILNYERKENDLIINLANGTKKVIPYSTKNEIKLLEIMKKQVEEANDFLNITKSRIARTKVLQYIEIAATFLAGLGILVSAPVPSLPAIGATVLTGSIITGIHGRNLQSKKNDLEKNQFFLRNEDSIKGKVTLSNTLLSILKGKTKKIILAKKEETPVLTINDISKIPFKDLQKIFYSLDADIFFEQYETSEEQSNQRKK